MEGLLGALAQGLCMWHLHSSKLRVAEIRVVGVEAVGVEKAALQAHRHTARGQHVTYTAGLSSSDRDSV